MCKFLQLAILNLWLVALANGATYYIDFSGGNNSNAGTSFGAPWKHSPGDTNATANPAATTLGAGDVVKFKGGVTYNGFIVLTNGGSSASPVVFDGNFANDWGTGRAVLDGMYHTNATMINMPISVSNVTVRGFAMQNAAGYEDNHPFITSTQSPPISVNVGGFGVLAWGGSRYENILVHDCTFNKMGNWRNHPSFDGNGCSTGFGVGFRYVFGGMVSNCVIMKTHTAVGLYACQDVTVYGNDISSNIVWGVDVAPATDNGGDVIKNITIRDNAIHDYEQFVQANWLGIGDPPHTDGVFLRDSDMEGTWTNINVFNNHFYCDNWTSSLGGTASIFVSKGASALIYNNVFNRDSMTRYIGVEYEITSVNPQIVRIFNNTFVGPAAHIIQADATVNRRIEIANNVFIKPAGQAANNIFLTALTGLLPNLQDWNLFYDPSHASGGKYYIAYPAYTLWPNRMAWYQVDTNSVYSDPLLIDVTNSTPSLRNFYPMAGSPALNLGTNLSAYFSTDKAGNARPASGPWTAGAFQVTNAPAGDTTPPTVSSVTIAANGTTWTIACNETVTVGAGGNGGFAPTMSGGGVTLTYSSGSGSSSLVYTGSRTVYSGETGTIAYTQPGNGIEDTSGNDLASFSGTSVVNNSTQTQTVAGNASRFFKLKGLRIR